MLNHRALVADINVGRDYLPDDYSYRNWNLGLLRGSLRCNDNNVFIYGNSGIWKTDSTGHSVSDFNKGLPEGVDFRNIKAMVQTPDGSLFAAGQFGLYRNDGKDGRVLLLYFRLTNVSPTSY